MVDIIHDAYEKYNSHIYFKPAFPLVYMVLYMFYYYTMLSPVYSLSDRISDVINPYMAMPYITGTIMLFVSLMYDGLLLKAIYLIMYVFAVGFSFFLIFKNTGNAELILYMPHAIIMAVNGFIWIMFDKYRRP